MAKDLPGVVSESGILPSLFGGGGGPTSLEEIKRRRAIAAALASRARPFPKTAGEGLTYLGEALGERFADQRLNAQEAALERQIGVPPTGAVTPPTGAVTPPPTAAPVTPPVAAAPRATSAPILTPAAPVVSNPRDLIARAIREREGITGPPEPQPAREVASSGPTEAGASALPPTSPTASASVLPSLTAGGDDDPIWAARQGAIGGIESSGQRDPYRAVGAPTKYGRGLGRYQVVEANVPKWTAEALGQPLTPQQFLADQQAQDAVFRHKFGQYVARFGEEGAAQAWFGGPGNVGKTGLSDVHKRLTIGDYGKTYLQGLAASTGATRVAAYAPTDTASDAPPVGARGGMVMIPPLTEENPETPVDIAPAPTRIAEMRSGPRGVVPGAAPPASRPGAAPADYDMPEPKPPEPIQRIAPTERETWARRALGINPEHPVARQVYLEEAANRKFQEDREVTRYNAQMTHFNTLHTKWQDLQVNRRKRGLEEQKLEQEIQLGKTIKAGENDRIFQADKDGILRDVTPDPKGVMPGGKPSVKLSETQAKTFGNLQTASIAHEQYQRIPEADKLLAEGLQDELAGRLPFVSNVALSARYRRARNAALQLADAQLREISGASIGVAEEAKAIARLFPVYGDDSGTLRQKAQIRDGIVTGMKLKLGDKGGMLADYAAAERARADATTQEKLAAEMKDVPKVIGKIYKSGDKRRYWTGSRWEDD